MAYDPRYSVLALTNAYYNEGTAEATQATYTYYPDDSMNGAAGGRIKTCQDVRYAGAMKNIAYEYMTGIPSKMLVAVGQVKREKNFTTGQTITEIRYPDNYPNPAYNDVEGWKRVQRRHEVRPDGSTREFQYSGGELPEYTDFQNNRIYQGYWYGSWPGATLSWNVTDARGNTTYREGPAYAPTSIRRGNHPPVRFTYTEGGYAFWLASRTDERGHVTTHQRYPDSHRISRTDYPDGGVEEFTYNQFGQVLTHRMTSGGVANFRYDARGRKTLFWPPATPSDPNPSGHPTQFIYYEWGPHTDRLERTIDPHGNSTWFYYNLRGQVTKVMHQDATFTQSGYNADGTLAWTADENHPNASWNESERTRYTYDEYKRVLTVTNPMGETTTNNYAIDINWAQPLLHTTNNIKYTLSPMGKNVVYDYDANLRKTSQVSALGTADEAWTLFEYDQVGNLTKTTDARFHETTFGYDDRNRRVTVTDALNHTTRTTYDAANNTTSVTRHGNPPLQFVEYDSMNRLKHKIDERGYHSYLGYDLAGNLNWQQDENGNIYEYAYDELNRKKSMTYPPEGLNGEGPRRTETWKYDWAGNLHKHTNRANVVQTYAPYDNRNRATWFDWSDGTPGQGFEYDAKSRLKRTYNAEANTTFHYDDADRKTSETQTVYSFGLNRVTTVGYQHDQDGNRSRVIYPAGFQFIYAYTHRNQLANIKLDPALFGAGYETPAVAYTYDGSGNRVLRTLCKGASTPNAGPGASTQYAVDQVNRVYAQASYFANNRVGRFDYGFDALNRRIYEQRDFGLADGFQYDATDQIIGYQREGTLDAGTGTVSSAVASTLQFDGAGNRTQITGSFEQNTYVRNKLNQYAHDAAGSAGYDEKGNLTTYAGWVVTYDAQNRLTRLEHAGTNQLILYKYDALNRRIAQQVNGAVTSYVFDNWNRIEERPTDGRQAHGYLFGGAVNEVVVSFGPGYHNYWYFQDGRGNTSHLADNDHVLLERYTYSFDGRVSYFDGNGFSRTTSSVENRFLFAGAILLPETMLYDMRNRIYYPRWGRFLQTDPIGFKGDASNLYRYCNNDPVNRTDPLGLDWGFFADEYPINFDNISAVPAASKGANGYTARPIFSAVASIIPAGEGYAIKYADVNIRSQSYIRTHQRRIVGTFPTWKRQEDRLTGDNLLRTTKHEGRQKGIDQSLYNKWHGDGTFKRMIEGDKIYSSPGKAGDALRQNEKSAKHEFETARRKLGQDLQNRDGLYQPNHFVPSSAPSAGEVDAAHQATGVPSQAAEAVNFVQGPR